MTPAHHMRTVRRLSCISLHDLIGLKLSGIRQPGICIFYHGPPNAVGSRTSNVTSNIPLSCAQGQLCATDTLTLDLSFRVLHIVVLKIVDQCHRMQAFEG